MSESVREWVTESASLFCGGKSAKNRLRLIATSSGKGGEVEGGGAMWGESGILLPPLPDDASPLLSRFHGQFQIIGRLASRLPPTYPQMGKITWIELG